MYFHIYYIKLELIILSDKEERVNLMQFSIK